MTGPAGARFCPDCGAGFTGAKYGSFGRRLGGYLLDYVIGSVVGLIPAFIVAVIVLVSIGPNETISNQQYQEQEDADLVAGFAFLGTYLLGVAA